jgi:hypothetical protein
MKKLFTFILFFLLFNSKSYSQSHIPFYGFELNNYETGDTLKYVYHHTDSGSGHPLTDIMTYSIIAKKNISGSSIRYTIKIDDGAFIDTIESVITNDTVYNNYNNILQLPVVEPATLDTIHGLKRLTNLGEPYIAVQNIGIITYGSWYVGIFPGFNDTLLYAHLTHYGIYDIHHPVILGVDNPSTSTSCISIRYDNGSPVLFISSSQNILSLTLTLYDLLGQKIETKSISIGNNPLNLNGFFKGMYLYKVSSNGNAIGQGKLMNL